MPKLVIDGTEVEVEDGTTLIQACEDAGVEIPRFCYHERLSIAGNCRMCLIEVVGSPKPMASCALSVNDLRPGKDGEPPEIKTNSEVVKKAREGVMEFLLINHPLDCPICDQGGECDLQDQAMAYGVDSSRFALNKRAVEDKNIGPLIKTIMTRCIHCTRCVRFMTEVAGVEELGAIGRGEDMEIVTYLERGMTSEMSGNVIDLCPVGALTSKPYAFSARSWELRKTESIDVMDAVGSHIRVDTRGPEVMRILPRINDAINQEWISDKTRFIWDGLRTQRLDRPYIRRDGKLVSASWEEAFNTIADKFKQTSADKIGSLAGDLAGIEELFALKQLLTGLGVKNIDARPAGGAFDPEIGRGSYLFNSTIEGIDEADVILLVGANPRHEAAVLSTRIRERWQSGELKVGLIGEQVDLTYDYEYLGSGAKTLQDLASGNHSFAGTLKEAKQGLIIVGSAGYSGPNGRSALALAAKIAENCGLLSEDWNGFNVLQNAASMVGALDIGFVPQSLGKGRDEILKSANEGELEILYLLGADDLADLQENDCFVIYQGSHGDRGAHLADVILPGAAYTEKSAIYVNLEGRPQSTTRAVFPLGDAKEDWTIIRALSDYLSQTLPYDNLGQLRAEIFKAHPHLAEFEQIQPAETSDIKALSKLSTDGTDEPFGPAVKDFYLTNVVSRASAVMAEMSALMSGANQGATGTDG